MAPKKPKKQKKVDLKCPKCQRVDKKIAGGIDEKILCGWCELWFHHSCVGLTDDIAATIDFWYCQQCITLDPETFEITYKEGNNKSEPRPIDQPEASTSSKVPVVSTPSLKPLNIKDRVGWFNFKKTPSANGKFSQAR